MSAEGVSAAAERPVRRKKIFLYGSCVSRDTFSFFGDDYELAGYVARQSMISAMNKPASLVRPRQELASNFQMRQLRGDLDSTLLRQLAAASTGLDLLLVDLVDERLGVLRIIGGSFATYSSEFKQSRSLDSVKGKTKTLQFGSDEHFEAWRDAAAVFARFIDILGLRSRTLVLETPWASAAEDGTPVPDSFTMVAEEANAKYERYYAYLREDLLLNTFRLPDSDVYSTEDHQWGMSPYHYVERAYETIREASLAHLRRIGAL